MAADRGPPQMVLPVVLCKGHHALSALGMIYTYICNRVDFATSTLTPTISPFKFWREEKVVYNHWSDEATNGWLYKSSSKFVYLKVDVVI